jgi:hypothetical protein
LTSVLITSIYFTIVAALSSPIESSCLVTDTVRPAVHSSIFMSNNADLGADDEDEGEDEIEVET